MNNEFELTTRQLELKRILNGISDISFSYSKIKNTLAQNTPLNQQIIVLEKLVQEARKILFEEVKP